MFFSILLRKNINNINCTFFSFLTTVHIYISLAAIISLVKKYIFFSYPELLKAITKQNNEVFLPSECIQSICNVMQNEEDLKQTMGRDGRGWDTNSKFPGWPQNILMAFQSKWWGFVSMLKRAHGAGKTKDKEAIMRLLCIFLDVRQLLKPELIINQELNFSKYNYNPCQIEKEQRAGCNSSL